MEWSGCDWNGGGGVRLDGAERGLGRRGDEGGACLGESARLDIRGVVARALDVPYPARCGSVELVNHDGIDRLARVEGSSVANVERDQ